MALPLHLLKSWARSQPAFASLCNNSIDLESVLDAGIEIRITLLKGEEISVEQRNYFNCFS